jgi:alanine dehydrogenase
MPGAVPITSTYALTNATLPFCVELADHGIETALASSPALHSGLNVHDGEIVHPAVAAAMATSAGSSGGQLMAVGGEG